MAAQFSIVAVQFSFLAVKQKCTTPAPIAPVVCVVHPREFHPQQRGLLRRQRCRGECKRGWVGRLRVQALDDGANHRQAFQADRPDCSCISAQCTTEHTQGQGESTSTQQHQAESAPLVASPWSGRGPQQHHICSKQLFAPVAPSPQVWLNPGCQSKSGCQFWLSFLNSYGLIVLLSHCLTASQSHYPTV